MTRKVPFEVDSALLTELGERLVGRPHVALAELIKNSYDADAPSVEIIFDSESRLIDVSDNGQGMDEETFVERFMRIGTTHKAEKKVSELFKRPLTGSKGIGRLSVQFLGGRLALYTVPRPKPGEAPRPGIKATIDWQEAVRRGDLTRAEAEIEPLVPGVTRFARGWLHGTRIEITHLRQEWTSSDLNDLAREVWSLQPPYEEEGEDALATGNSAGERSPESQPDPGMAITFVADNQSFEESFRRRIDAIRRMKSAHLTASYRDGVGTYSLVLADGSVEEPVTHTFIPEGEARLLEANCKIQIFFPKGKQAEEMSVGEMRDYLNRWGGVQVFDAGFRLPFYGDREHDWLKLEFDYAHRLSASKLIPAELQIKEGMNNLPTSSNVLGTVHVNTSRERREFDKLDRRGEPLSILLTRDRLVDNAAFLELQRFVRFGLDLYAHRETARRVRAKQAQAAPIRLKQQADKVLEVLDLHREAIPKPAFEALKKASQDTAKAAEVHEDVQRAYVGLLGSLATAGMVTLAYRHELEKTVLGIEGLATELERQAREVPALAALGQKARRLVERTRRLNDLFSALTDQESRETREAYRALLIINEAVEHLRFLAPDVQVGWRGFDDDVRLPPGTLAEWMAIFQNVLVNAFNAMLATNDWRLEIRFRRQGKGREILICDAGVGIDLVKAEELFAPFKRALELPIEKKSLGYGGTGLGLTIVRMIADELKCKVDFIKPLDGWKTTFRLRWTEESKA